MHVICQHFFIGYQLLLTIVVVSIVTPCVAIHWLQVLRQHFSGVLDGIIGSHACFTQTIVTPCVAIH
jgi:hypothetical protein